MASLLVAGPILDPSAVPCLKLREDLEDLCVPNDNSVPEHRRLFPKSAVRALCTEDRIKIVLQCSCTTCKEHQRMSQRRRDSSDYLATITGTNNSNGACSTSDCAIILFALLTCSECPSLIYTLLDNNLTDGYFESHVSKFTAQYIQQKYWPTIRTRFLNKFHWNKFRFAVPYMRDSNYEEYSSETILPFLRETRLDRENEGSYGKVFAFEVLDEYQCIPRFSGVRRFARKELHPDTSSEQFNSEYRNLLFVKRLQDEHIVKLVKAYKHGGCYNFIFPCAKTNLRLYLRQEQFHLTQHTSSIIGHPLWPQMLALARGLHKVLDFEEPGVSHESSQFGYHLDLKPANILVEETNDLTISDFGQATFKRVAGATSSKVTGMGGTEAYAPPEIDSREARQSRRYDIWSFGCIFLEVVSFVLRGCEGVRNLDRIRSTKFLGTNSTDDRFFRPKFPNSYELKPEVMKWIQLLPQSCEGHEKDFLNEVLLLILQMLDVHVNSRLTSKGMCIRLADILDRFQSYPKNAPGIERHEATPPRSGREVGKELMKSLPLLSYNISGFWKSGPLRFVQEEELLRIETLENQIWKESLLDDISRTRLVLRYAFRDQASNYYSDSLLYFFPPGQSKGKLSVKNHADVHRLQEILLGQEVRLSMKLRSVQVELKDQSLVPKKLRHWHGGPACRQHGREIGVSNVQLWTESSHREIADLIIPPRSSKRQSPRYLRTGPLSPRIIIFDVKSILIIRIKKNVRISQSSGAATTPSLTFVPTDKGRDPSFSASFLETRSRETLPSFPLTRDALEQEELENCNECSSLTLEFPSNDQAQSFHRMYKRIKKAWSEELKHLEKIKSDIGSELGYACS